MSGEDVRRCTDCGFARGSEWVGRYCDHPEVNRNFPSWLAGGNGVPLAAARGWIEVEKSLPWPQRRKKYAPKPPMVTVTGQCGIEGKFFVPKEVMELCEEEFKPKRENLFEDWTMVAHTQQNRVLKLKLKGFGFSDNSIRRLQHQTDAYVKAGKK